MDRADLRRVEKTLEEMGYWFPPDAIAAVYEGRETYTALDGRTEWKIRPNGFRDSAHGVITRAIKKALPAHRHGAVA